MSYVNIAVGVSKFITGWSQGRADKMNANTQAMLADAQADQEHQAGLQQAQIIRRARDYAVSGATAQYGASGVKLGEGSAEEVTNTIQQQGTQDAWNAIVSADRRATATRLQGRLGQYNARSQAGQETGSALASGAASAYSGWKTYSGPSGSSSGRSHGSYGDSTWN